MRSHDKPAAVDPAAVAFFVGEVPCAPFITALINGVAKRRKVFVFGSERRGKGSGFGDTVFLEQCPQARWRRVWFVAKGLASLFFRRSLDGVSLWNYVTLRGRHEVFSRLAFALPLLVHRPEIAHIQWAKALQRVMELRQLHSFAVVLSLRGTHVSSSPYGDPQLLREYHKHFPAVDAFHAVCEAIKRDAVVLGAPPARIRVIYSGVDRALLDAPPPVIRDVLGPIRILSVGRIHWRKGYHRALDAIAELRKTVDVRYRIVAGSPDEELLLQLSDLELGDEVEFLPSMSRDEVIDCMRRDADVLLVPSMGEGIANVAIEAMAVGLPVVATDCGGMPELIRSGENGLLCSPWCVDEMVNALREFSSMTLQQRQEMQNRARSFVANHRQLGELVSEMQALYDDALRCYQEGDDEG